MRLIILSIAAGLFLGSCSTSSEPPVKIKKGEEFSFDGQKMTVDFKASTVVVSEEDQQVLVAPEGKIYLLVDVKGQNSMYFASLKEGDKEIERVDYLESGPFVRKLPIETSDKSDLYLVDENGKYSIEIKAFGDGVSASLNVTLKDEATVKVNDRMKAFLKEFENGSGILAAAKNYVKSGVNPFDITTDNGGMMLGDPATHGLKIVNIKADGTYVCSAEVWYETIEVTWDGDNISKIAATSGS